jgi:NADPH:quinone reductase-like Zn-dependent oxidoreductase
MASRKALPRRRVVAGGIGLALGSLGTAAAREQPSVLPRRFRAYEVGDGKSDLTLHMVERPMPAPGPGEVLLKVRATGLNARDLSLMRNVRIYGGAGGSPTRVPLDDNACEVVRLGAGVNRIAPGDRVVVTHFPRWIDGAWNDEAMSGLDFSVNADGFLAEYVVVGAEGLVKIPATIADEAAATFPNAGLTAWHAVVVDSGIRPGDVLVTLGTGGVSVYGMQWAKMMGARVVVTSSSDEKLARMRQLGADVGINYRSRPEWHKDVLAATGGRGADVVLNTVGIGELERCLLACGSNGRVMEIGANPVRRTGPAVEAAGLRDFPRGMLMKGLTIRGVIVGSRRMLEDLVQAAVANRIAPVIDRVFPFDQALAAVRYMESGEKVGKIVIKIA